MTTAEYTKTGPQIYVACLSAYNNGYLHGSWIDVDRGIDHVQERIKEILSTSPMAKEEPCEEWAIHDYQGFGNYNVEEYNNLDVLCAIAELLKQWQDKFPEDVISSLVQDFGIVDAHERMENDYIGEFDSDTDLAYHVVEETGFLEHVPKEVLMYFDYEAFGRDLDLNGDVMSFSGHYFWNR